MSGKKIKIFQVDAFTDKKFKGNPAAVVLLDGPCDEVWMQSVAAEMNLSETAFFYPLDDGYNLRWFTPTTEVDLCGHATLASAFVLYNEELKAHNEAICFHTRSGELIVRQKSGLLELNFPAEPSKEFMPPPILLRALGAQAVSAWQNRMGILVELNSEQDVRHLSPDFAALKEVPVQGVIVSSRSDSSEFDFVSRFFAPRLGINEDPVTGSAHCCLGPFWAQRLKKKKMRAYQASVRGGILSVEVEGDRVKLGGNAAMVFRGELC